MTSVVKNVTKTVKNIANGSGKNKQKNKPSVISQLKNSPTVKCIVKFVMSPIESPEGQEIIRLCNELYRKYERRFSDHGRLNAIKKEIDKVKAKGI